MRNALILVASVVAALPLRAQAPYYPARNSWQTRTAAQAGFDSGKLQAAIDYAKTQENTQGTDSAGVAKPFAGEGEYNAVIGPWHTPRGPEGGVIVRHGYIVAEWGEPQHVDMTHSVTKSFLATVFGLAYDDGLIPGVLDTVAHDVPVPEFTDDAHNARITWRDLLTQTSEWQGTLWGKPDWADRFNAKLGKRPVLDPGTVFTYNDVRVNVLSLAVLNVWRRPLPQVLKERIMDPIGASTTWRWWGYNNSWVDLDGLRVQSVSGGGHWGGGMHISAEDMARFGLLMLRNGKWNSRQLVSQKWIAMSTSPSPVKADYGFLWWLNTNNTAIKNVPASAFMAEGNGGNYIYMDREHDLVIVLRWTRDFPGVIERITAALASKQ